jgi:hypothetical protein
MSNNVQGAFDKLNAMSGPLIEGAKNLQNILSKGSAPKDQIHAELARLMSESKEYQELIVEAKNLENKKEELLQKMTTTINDITTTTVYLQKDVVAIDGLSRDVFNGNSVRDLRAMKYLDDMERRAKERLLKYHYYMAKSYEYRLLKPYTAELNLSKMFDRFRAIAEINPDRIMLSSEDFQNLKAVYEEQLSTVTANILDEYNTNRPELSIPIRFSLTQADLESLNSGNEISLNIFERGMIPPYEENVRIVNFKIHDMKVHREGGESNFAYFDLLLEHSGKSMLRKNGEIYWFNHINQENQNPIIWGIRYDANNGITNAKEPSFASQSLLYSLLDKLGKKDEIMIYSRPGAWADILISKNDVTSDNTKMIIDELTFELQYDFVQRPTNNRNLDVYAGDVEKSNILLSPYIKTSRVDKNNRSDGRGTFYRTYNRGTELNLEAPEESGRWKFINWTNRYDEIVSNKTQVNANMNNDNYLTANYRYTGPVLSVQDSIYVGQGNGTITVKVENKGSEEMEWSVLSNDPWIKIISGEKGIDTEYITLEYEKNPSATKRTGSITVTAPETPEYSKNIQLIQSNLLSIENIKPNVPIIAYNQATNTYSVNLNTRAQNISVDVFSANGQLILRKYYHNDSLFNIDLSHCSKGVYLIKTLYDGKLFIQKVVK